MLIKTRVQGVERIVSNLRVVKVDLVEEPVVGVGLGVQPKPQLDVEGARHEVEIVLVELDGGVAKFAVEVGVRLLHVHEVVLEVVIVSQHVGEEVDDAHVMSGGEVVALRHRLRDDVKPITKAAVERYAVLCGGLQVPDRNRAVLVLPVSCKQGGFEGNVLLQATQKINKQTKKQSARTSAREGGLRPRTFAVGEANEARVLCGVVRERHGGKFILQREPRSINLG